MKTFHRKCVKDAHVEAQNGDRHEIKRDEVYLTSAVHDDDTVMVFGNFWTPFHVSLFTEPERFT